MKYLIYATSLFYLNISFIYACTPKDYNCIKDNYIQSKKNIDQKSYNQVKNYNYNQKHYISGQYDQAPIQLNDYYNHNIKIYARNTQVTNTGGNASIVNIGSSSHYNRITLNATGNIQNTAIDIRSKDICVSLICSQNNANNNTFDININNANINHTIR